MKQLKKDIEYNFDLEVFLDPFNRLWIKHNDYRIDIQKIGIKKEIYFGAHNSITNESYNCVCENDDVVLYLLLKYCKDVHKWGEFNNLN
jgi:hypothetical protein